MKWTVVVQKLEPHLARTYRCVCEKGWAKYIVDKQHVCRACLPDAIDNATL